MYKLILQLCSPYFFSFFLFAESELSIAELKLAQALGQSELAKREIYRMKRDNSKPEVTTTLDTEMYRHLMNIVSFL